MADISKETLEIIEKLRLMHEVLREDRQAAWKRAGFASGQAIAEMGCGPGFAAIDLARLVKEDGRVIACDKNSEFISFLNHELNRLNISNVEGVTEDLDDPCSELPPLDAAYAGFVMCYLKQPKKSLKWIFDHLQPEGVLLITDYLSQTFWASSEVSKLDEIIKAIEESWSSLGGTLGIQKSMPRILGEIGFQVTEIKPILHTAKPDSNTFKWIETFLFDYVPQLVAKQYLESKDWDAFKSSWANNKEEKGFFITAPPIVDIVARKVSR